MEISFTRVRVLRLLSVLMIVMGFVFKPLVRIVGKPYIPCCDIEKLIDGLINNWLIELNWIELKIFIDTLKQTLAGARASVQCKKREIICKNAIKFSYKH